MKKAILTLLGIILLSFNATIAQGETVNEEETLTVICNNLLEIILSHQENHFKSLEGKVLFMQGDSLKIEWDPEIYLIDGTNCILSEIWGSRSYTCTIDEGMFSQSLDEIYEMMKIEVIECLSQYCEFFETTEKEMQYDEIIYKRMSAKINEYFEAGVTIRLYEDEKKVKHFELKVY